jgi:transcriptional regulator with GAF, ATPase, and Fis domain
VLGLSDRVDDPGKYAAHEQPLRFGLIVLGDARPELYELPARGRVTIGRNESSDVVIRDVSISRRHACLEIDSVVRVQDLRSANGVRVNGARIRPDELVPVAPGEVIELGDLAIVLHHAHALSHDGRDDLALGVERLITSDLPRTLEDAGIDVLVEDSSMHWIFDVVRRVADTGLSVLLHGEPGVGKEAIAETLHRVSRRARQPYVRLNCASVRAEEIFGSSPDPSAVAPASVFTRACGGTLFFDDVDSLPFELHERIANAIDAINSGSSSGRSRVRLVAASVNDLSADVARGTFSRDLYDRISGLRLRVPPLRDRPLDLYALTREFASRAASVAGMRSPPIFSRDAVTLLRRHPWPGNVRELRSVVERAVLLAGTSEVSIEHLPPVIAERPLET